MRFVRYQGRVGIIAETGREMTEKNIGSDLDDHLGLWFGDFDQAGRPVIYSIPAELVQQSEAVESVLQH